MKYLVVGAGKTSVKYVLKNEEMDFLKNTKVKNYKNSMRYLANNIKSTYNEYNIY